MTSYVFIVIVKSSQNIFQKAYVIRAHADAFAADAHDVVAAVPAVKTAYAAMVAAMVATDVYAVDAAYAEVVVAEARGFADGVPVASNAAFALLAHAASTL